jgi:hypothetical protein
MMRPRVSEFLAFESTLGADGTRPSLTGGTAVTPGASSSYGSYTQLGTLVTAQDAYEVEIVVTTVAVSAANRMIMLMVAADPAGGTSFAGNEIIQDLLVGAPSTPNGNGAPASFVFPLKVKSGASFGVKAASLDATTTAINVWINVKEQPSRLDLTPHGQFVRTFGVSSPTVAGVAITPGGASEGAWTEIGTLAEPLWYFIFGYSINDTTMTAAILNVDLALGDASNKRVIMRDALVLTTAAETLYVLQRGAFARGQIGDKIYARVQGSTTADTTNSIAVYGVGG